MAWPIRDKFTDRVESAAALTGIIVAAAGIGVGRVGRGTALLAGRDVVQDPVEGRIGQGKGAEGEEEERASHTNLNP